MNRILLPALVALALSGCGGPPASKAAAPDKPATATPAAPSAAVRAPQTLLDVSGSGTKKTNSFRAASAWDVNWSAKDNSGFGACYIGVTVYDASGNMPVAIAVNQSVRTSAQDVDHEHKPGTYYLDINAANCDWRVTVTG